MGIIVASETWRINPGSETTWRYLDLRNLAGFGTHATSYQMCISSSFPRGKAVEAWSFSFTSLYYGVKEFKELYLHSPYVFMNYCLNTEIIYLGFKKTKY
jgi:hypothetical protein